MNTDYIHTWPNVEGRERLSPKWFEPDDIVAFRYIDYSGPRTGLMLVSGSSEFEFAINLYKEEGRVWSFDLIPDERIEFYKPTQEECNLVRLMQLEGIMQDKETAVDNLFIYAKQIAKHCEESSSCRDERTFQDMISVLPQSQMIDDWDAFKRKVWQSVYSEIDNIGIQLDRKHIELISYIMGVLMIQNYTPDNDDSDIPFIMSIENRRASLMALMREKWRYVGFMYSLLYGRVVTTRFNNMVALMNHLCTHFGYDYLRLYLIAFGDEEQKISKILKYSPTDKREKLKAALDKMKKTAELNDQKGDLNELFQILFPKHFRDHVDKTIAPSSYREMKRELEEQKQVIQDQTQLINEQNIELAELRLIRDAAEKITANYNGDAIPFEELKKAIDAIRDPEKAQQFFFQLNHILRKYPLWKKHEDEFADFIDEKMNAKDNEATANTAMIVEAVSKQKAPIIGQMNLGNGTQQLPLDFPKALENIGEPTE